VVDPVATETPPAERGGAEGDCGEKEAEGREMKVPIDDCPAGPWLDEAAAGAMRWRREYVQIYGSAAPWVGNDGNVVAGMDWSPSSNIEAAWELVEKLRNESMEMQEAFIASLVVQRDRWSEVNDQTIAEWLMFNVFRWLFWKADTPLAITRAFCKAHGITEVEVPDA